MQFFLFACIRETHPLLFHILYSSHTYRPAPFTADLRYWGDLEGVLTTIHAGGIQLQELNLAGNTEAGSKVIARASRLFGQSLGSLILSGCLGIDKIALAFVSGLSQLHSLDISDVPFISDDNVIRILDRDLPQLHTLNISGCTKLTDESLHAVARTNHRFLALQAARNFNITQIGANDVLMKCESLTHLDLSYCPGLRALGVIVHVGASPKKGPHMNPNPGPEDGNYVQYAGRPLKILKLDECSHLLEMSLDYCAGSLAGLTHVHLPRIPGLTDATVQGFAWGAFGLTVLCIQGCKNVRGTALETLGSHAKALQELNIANIGPFSEKSLRKLLTSNTTLTYVNASNNRGVTDKTFSEMEIPNSGGIAIFLPHIKRLSLAHTSLTGFGVACLSERCANLEHLDISGHAYINDAALSVVAGCCRSLKSLWLNDCPAITDKGVISICYACKFMEVLHLSDSRRVLNAWGTRVTQFSDAIIEACLDGLRCLRELSLRNQCGIFLASPWILTELNHRGGHQFLEKIDLRGADCINLAAAAVLFQQCSELCFVLLSPETELPNVTSESFWTSAFAGCMYTQAYVNPNINDESSISGGSSVAGNSTIISGSATSPSAKLPGTPAPPEPMPAGVEHGRYSGDDGVGSLVSGVFSKVLSDLASESFLLKRSKADGGIGDQNGSISTIGQGSVSVITPTKDGSMIDFSVSKKKGFGDNGSIASLNSDGSRRSRSRSPKKRDRSMSPARLIDSVIKALDSNDAGSVNGSAVKAEKGLGAGMPPAPPPGYLALAGHPLRKSLRYRDLYIRRRLEEQSCARFIQFKWKLYALWQRFRRRLSARKIANTYKVILEARKMAILLKALAMENSAKRIQRYFRNSKLPLVKAAIKIQKIYRGHACKNVLYRKAHEDWASVRIQSLIRGVLVRISERFILAQIYLKLPAFWRAIMNTVPPSAAGVSIAPGEKGISQEEAQKNAADEAVRKRIFPYQIQEARADVQNIMRHIIEDVATDGVLKPQMSLVVAQPFDKKPYLSNQYGQHIDYYSHIDGLLSSDTAATTGRAKERREKAQLRLKYDENGMDMFKAAERARKNGSTVENMSILLALKAKKDAADAAPPPMHCFNMAFWPHTTPHRPTDTSIEQHDPMINSFDIATNHRDVLFCETCRTRMRIVMCNTCMRGYCFFCAFRTHTEATRRNHVMSLMEPRVIAITEPTKSLVYHIDMAQHASYDLRYLVKYMRSRAEVQRLQAEKRMAKEYEEQEEARRMQFLRAQGESNDKHQAATEIALLYRCKRARKIVHQRREQIQLEAVTKEEARQKVCWIPFQKLFRTYSTRKWFRERNVNYKLFRKKKKKRVIKKDGDPPAIPRVQLDERIAVEIKRRRIVARQSLFENMIVKYSHLQVTLKTNIAHWLKIDSGLPAEIQSLLEQKDLVSEMHAEESQVTAAQKGVLDPEEYEKLEKKLDATYKRVETAQNRLDNCRNISWWITTYLRNSYRRLKAIEVRIKDTCHRLEWVNHESNIVGRIESHVFKRIEVMKLKLGMGLAVDWLQRYGKKMQIHQATLDAQQESLILEETHRIERDEHITVEVDSLMEELYQGILADSHLSAERVQLQVEQLCEVHALGSDEALRCSEALLTIKRKLTQLNNNVIDAIKVGLQAKFNDEDDKNAATFIFPGDSPDLLVKDFILIECRMLDPYSHPKHVQITDFLDIYLVQPWLAEQAVGDVRLEEIARQAEIDRGKAIEEKKGIETTIADNDKKAITLRKNIMDLKEEIDTRSVPPEGDDVDPETELEKEEREALVGFLGAELFKKEGELDVCIEVNSKVSLQIGPLEQKINDFALDIEQQHAHIKAREDERERLRSIFFESEVDANHELFIAVAKLLEQVDKEMLENEHRNLVFKAAAHHDPFLDRVLERGNGEKLSLMERECLRIPLNSQSLALVECLKIVKPRTTPSAGELIKASAATRLLFGESNYNVYEKLKDMMDAEETWMNAFATMVPKFQRAVAIFQDALLAQRRQKAMQVEIEARKKRLEFLRTIRMRALQEEKAKALAEATRVEEQKKKERSERIPIGKRIAAATKAGIRAAGDFIRDLRHSAATAMDQEELRMARTIRARNKGDSSAMPEGIRKFHICQGTEENQQFADQQTALEDRGIPFFQKMPRSFGNQFYLWFQFTYDNKLMITNLEITSNDPTHATFKDPAQMAKDKWEEYTHHNLNCIFYVKRDPTKIFAYKELELSLSEAEENRNMVEGYEKYDQCLDQFGLPDMYFWVKKIAKIAHSGAQNTDEVINEVVKVRELLAKNPGDRNMQALMKRLNDKLKKAYEKETANIVTNPLRQAVDLLSLQPHELEEWMRVFGEVDKKGEGSVDFDEIFEYFEETPTFFSKEIFYSMDALDELGKIEFGDFLRAIGTYCFFGKEEVLRFMFIYTDKGKKGFITHAEFVTLLNTLNPFEKQRAKRALQELQMVEGKKMEFDEFCRMNEEFPNTMHPAFRLQNAFRTKILGVDWWFDKLAKYKGVRHKLLASSSNTDETAELEMQRFQNDQKKMRRMKEREDLIRNEGSAIRKVILQAQQMVDEFS